MNLENKIAIVTGSGRGIGRSIALRLAEAGASIIINDINEDAEVVAQEIQDLDKQSKAVIADVSLEHDVVRLIEATMTTFGRIDILVNNAGINRDQLLIRMTEEDWDRVININLKSIFLCTRAALRPMIKQRWGRIICVSSIVGVMGNAGQTNYAAAKAGIIGFTRSVAKEVASRGITANTVAPGFIDTEMTQKLSDDRRQEITSHIPIGHLGSPQDVASAICFLASEEASYITGQVLTVDGGLT